MNRLHDNDLDRLFAEKLDDLRVEPPERSWKKVAAGITITTTVTATALSNFIRPVIWSLSTIATVVLVTISNPSSNNSSEATPIIQAEIPSAEIVMENQVEKTPHETLPVVLVDEAPQLISVVLPEYTAEEATSPEVLQENKIPESPAVEDRPVWLMSIKPKQIVTPELSWNPDLLKAPDINETDKSIIPAWFDLSVQSGPDILDFGLQNNQRTTSFAYNNGMDLSFHFSDFYLRTGVNVLSTFQKNQYDYSINEYQQTGSYTMVDSISFIQGTDTAGQLILIPQYYTSSHAVYDSVAVEHSTRASDRYQYLEIPFALGFQKDLHKVSIYAQAGFTYSFLMGSKELTESEFMESNSTRPLTWQSQSPDRNKDFWSFSLAAGVMYNTNNRFSFGLEPTYRYCMSPLYAGNETAGKAPVSYGLRLRLQYKLSY